jgi:xanthine/uracil permease
VKPIVLGVFIYVIGYKYIEIKLGDIIYTSRTNERRNVRAVACISDATIGG